MDGRRKIITAFIVVYIFVVHGFWLCPPLPWRARIFNSTRPLVDIIGLGGANFAVFAPQIGHENVRLYALVRDDNCRTIIWVYPCVEQWSLTQRIYNDRFRKYSEIFRLASCVYRRQIGLWIDVARFAARACDSPQFRPSNVFFVLHRNKITLPGGNPDATPVEDETLFAYSLKPGDL